VILRRKITAKKRYTIGLISCGLLAMAWLLATEVLGVNPMILPGPGALAASAKKLHYENYLIANALTSLLRITLGFIAAAVVAIPVGIAMGAFSSVRAALNPILSPLRYLPIAAIIPVFIFWFELGETMKISLLFLGTFVYLLPLVVETVDQVDDVYLKIAQTLGAGPVKQITTILLPACLPAIFDALRVMFGIGWTYVMLAEFMQTTDQDGLGYPGVGYLMNQLRRFGTLSDVLVAVALILFIGVLVDMLMRWLGATLFPWYDRS